MNSASALMQLGGRSEGGRSEGGPAPQDLQPGAAMQQGGPLDGNNGQMWPFMNL